MSAAEPYIAAVGLVGTALGAGLALQHTLDARVLAEFYVATLAVSWRYGQRPGWFACLLSFVAADWCLDNLYGWEVLARDVPMFASFLIGCLMSAYAGSAVHQRRPVWAVEVLMDDEGTPYVPLPDDAEGNLRQIVQDGRGWKLVVLTPQGVETRAKGHTVEAVLRAADRRRGSRPPAEPATKTGEVVTLRVA